MNIRNWNSLDKIIVQALCERSMVSSVEIHERYKVSPLSIFESVQKLGGVGIAAASETNIIRGPLFAEKIIELRHAIYHRPMPWKRG